MAQKCVIYARYSSDRQREESIEGQIRVCEEYALKNDLEVVQTYTDRALTARTDRRPAFQQMIADCKKRQFSYILVYKLNRFSRNRYDSAVYKHKIAQYGVKVLSAMERITDDPSGILLESLIEGIAEYYSAELAENVHRGMTENALEGKSNGRTPLGYKKGPGGKIVIDEREAKAVRFIFQSIAEGQTLKKIAEQLNEKGYRNSFGRPFVSSNFGNLLKNKKYIGIYHWGNEDVEGVIPPILDRATFDKVQEIVESRKHKGTRKRVDAYLLTGRMTCGLCGAPYVGKSGTSHTGDAYAYYCCSTRAHRKTCKGKNYRQDKLEEWLAIETLKALNNPETIHQLAAQIIKLQEEAAAEPDPLIDNLEAELKDYTKRLNNSIKAIEAGVISETISQNISDYENKIKALERDLSRAKLKRQPFTLTMDHIEFFLTSLLSGDSSDKKYRSQLIDTLIAGVVIYDDRIEVFYKYKKELPLLPNPLAIREEGSSNGKNLVTRMFVYANIKLKVCQSYFSIFTALAA